MMMYKRVSVSAKLVLLCIGVGGCCTVQELYTGNQRELFTLEVNPPACLYAEGSGITQKVAGTPALDTGPCAQQGGHMAGVLPQEREIITGTVVVDLCPIEGVSLSEKDCRVHAQITLEEGEARGIALLGGEVSQSKNSISEKLDSIPGYAFVEGKLELCLLYRVQGKVARGTLHCSVEYDGPLGKTEVHKDIPFGHDPEKDAKEVVEREEEEDSSFAYNPADELD